MASFQLFVRCLTLILSLIHCQGYFIDDHINCTNVYNAIPQPSKSTQYVKFLGTYESTNDCIKACKQNGNCSSYTYFTSYYTMNSSYKQHCYGRFNDPLWTIIPQINVNCGRVIYPCKSSIDCSLNGECNVTTGNCSCNIAWSGYRCNQLNLLPAKHDSGYNQTAFNISSWGARTIIDYNNPDNKTKYHMFVSQIANHCGYNAFRQNSQLIHTQSTNGWNSPYEFINKFHGPYSHSIDLLYGPNKEFVAYYEYMYYKNETFKPCNCTDGSTPPSCDDNLDFEFQEGMQWTLDITNDNEWSNVTNINNYLYNSNFAGVILKNGSMIGMSRIWENGQGSFEYLSTASNWLNNQTYIMFNPSFEDKKELFPQLTAPFTEDQFLYIDCDGNYHALFHNMSPSFNLNVVGGHAFSKDGRNWIYAGSSFDNVIIYEDGTSLSPSRRERASFVFADDRCTPIALTTAVFLGGGTYGDTSTLTLQPIKH